MRNIAAVAAHDALDGARNPVMLAMLATCALLAFVFSSVVGTDWLGDARAEAFLMTVAIAIAPAYTGSVGLLYVMSPPLRRRLGSSPPRSHGRSSPSSSRAS